MRVERLAPDTIQMGHVLVDSSIDALAEHRAQLVSIAGEDGILRSAEQLAGGVVVVLNPEGENAMDELGVALAVNGGEEARALFVLGIHAHGLGGHG